jgi:hypothetical protein
MNAIDYLERALTLVRRHLDKPLTYNNGNDRPTLLRISNSCHKLSSHLVENPEIIDFQLVVVRC